MFTVAYVVLTWDPSSIKVHHEEDKSTTSSGSPRPEQEKNTLQWAIPSAQSRKRRSRTERFDSLLERYMQQKRKMEEADEKQQDEERAAFEYLTTQRKL